MIITPKALAAGWISVAGVIILVQRIS